MLKSIKSFVIKAIQNELNAFLGVRDQNITAESEGSQKWIISIFVLSPRVVTHLQLDRWQVPHVLWAIKCGREATMTGYALQGQRDQEACNCKLQLTCNCDNDRSEMLLRIVPQFHNEKEYNRQEKTALPPSSDRIPINGRVGRILVRREQVFHHDAWEPSLNVLLHGAVQKVRLGVRCQCLSSCAATRGK